MSKVDLLDKDGNTYRTDVFTRSENGVDVLTQAVANVDPNTGTLTDFATQQTLGQVKSLLETLIDKTDANSTVALDAGSLAALETVTANTNGLTDDQLRATALNVTVSNPTSNITGFATETTLNAINDKLPVLENGKLPVSQEIDTLSRTDEYINYLKTEDAALGVDNVSLSIPHPDYPTQIDPSQTVRVGGLTQDGFLLPQRADKQGAQVLSDAPNQVLGVGYNAAGGSIVAQVDTQGYQSVSLQLSGTFVATVSFFASNDGRDWFSVAGYYSAGGNIPVASSSVAGLYSIPAIGRYFKATITAFTSGSVQAVTFLRNQPAALLSQYTSTNFQQLLGTTIVTGGLAGVMAIGGNVAQGIAPTTNPVNIGGWDGKLTRRLLTDTNGAIATYSVPAPTYTQYTSDSVTDLLALLVKEMQIMNRLVCELASLGDADAQLREDVTFKNLLIN